MILFRIRFSGSTTTVFVFNPSSFFKFFPDFRYHRLTNTQFFAIISCLILFWQSATIIPFSKSVNSRVFFFFPIKDNFVCLQQHKKHSLNLSRLIIRELEKISTFAVLETRFPRLWEATKFVNMSNGFS